MGCSLQAPLSPGPSRPLRLCLEGQRCRVHRQTGFPISCTSSIWGKYCEEGPRRPWGGEGKEGEIGRVWPIVDYPQSPLFMPPPPNERNKGFGFPGPKALLKRTYQLLLSLQPEMLQLQEGTKGAEGQTTGSSCTAVPCFLETRALVREKTPGPEEWVMWLVI